MSLALKESSACSKDPVKDFLAALDPQKASLVKTMGERLYSYITESGVYADLPQDDMLKLRDSIRAGTPWREAVFTLTQERKHAWLEKIVLSPARSLVLDVLDFRNIRSALDLGSGWGQLTQSLARQVAWVVSVELGLERLEVNHAICSQEGLSNTTFLHADGLTLPFRENSFDLVVLDGVFEWLAAGKKELPHIVQRDALNTIHSLLARDGTLLIAIENRCGYKYLLGENDDHIRIPYVNILPFEEARALYFSQTQRELQARTYSVPEYKLFLEQAGFAKAEFYAAFPDYKLPELVIPLDTPEVLKHAVETLAMPEEHDGSDGCASKNAEIIRRGYRALNNLGILGYLAPSFIIVARKD